ncbi:transporter [Rubrivivax gelatinosus]|nr:transporter [Rubrivivax gelatinosus]
MAAHPLRHALGVLGLAVALPAAAQTAGVDWRSAVEAAWSRSVQAVDAAGQRRSALAEHGAASSLWAASPALELEQLRKRQQPGASSRETELGIALPLWLPGQRGARLAAADAQAAVASAAADAARLQLAGAVQEAAWAVWMQQAEVESAAIQADEFEALAHDVARRVRAGDLARTDALAADAERLAGEDARARARLALQAAEARWTTLTGLATLPPRPADAPVAAGPPDTHPLLREAGARLELARKRLEAVRLSRRDAPELVLRAHQERGGGEPEVHGVGVALRIPLASAERHEPLLSAALAEAELAEASQTEVRRQLELALTSAVQDERAARQQLANEAERARLLRERAALIQKSFDAGQSPLPEALRALTQALQAEAAMRRQAVAAALAAARLQQARGLMP